MRYPRVLVVSNQCFSESTSNGRTLGTLFKGWPHDRIRQFCLSLDNPDMSVCSNYFTVSDKDALKSCMTLGYKHSAARSVSTVSKTHGAVKSGIKKTALTFIIRNLMWGTGLWKSREYKEWLEDFKPEIVVFQSGDSAFMADIVLDISRKYNTKLVIFNTEGYIFFKHNYLRHHFSDFFAFPLFKYDYRRSFIKTFKASDISIYLNGRLESDYQKLYQHNSRVIYNSSEMVFKSSAELNTPPTFAYLGNLGIKRPQALAEFAEVLQSIAPECHIDVYGRLPSDYDGILERTNGIEYHGLVSYDRVKEVINSTDFLLHVEKDDPVLIRELQYGFSTKIADSICSGRNFIVYAPASLACSKYISETGAAWLASSRQELRDVLKTVLTDSDARNRVLTQARITAVENHSAEKNRVKFQKILCSL